MPEFKCIFDYIRFASRTTEHFRYIRDAESEEFLSTVRATANLRSSILEKGIIVWRAQFCEPKPNVSSNDDDGMVTVAFDPLDDARMKPRPDAAKEGRVNSKGIPVLYVATKPETAMSEKRPSLASTLSLAKLKICKNLKILDCTKGSSSRPPLSYLGHPFPSGNEREEVVWGSINDAFSRPVDDSDDLAPYAPTQVLAECFKRDGYDGIKYRSSYGTTGQNLVLFSLAHANICPGHTKLVRVKSINIDFTDW
jgi:RES domain